MLYDYISLNDRKRATLSQEFRLASDSNGKTNWLVGLYALRLDDDLLTINRGDYYDPFYDFADAVDSSFGSDYQAQNLALFGQIDRLIGAKTRLSVGLRAERRSTDYSDSDSLTLAPSDTMAGGDISLSHDRSDALTLYVGLSKGYKAGGLNIGDVPPGYREFRKEALWNIEAGIKSLWLDGALNFNAAIFYNRRDDQQVRRSFQIGNDPTLFGFLTVNAERGNSLGIEADMRRLISESWEFYANLGLINTEFDRFSLAQAELGGRAQAHAPEYTFALGGLYRHSSGWFARVDVSGKDAFYFDVSHDQRSSAYELVNARLGFDADSWTANLWVRNIFDEEYAVRGFYFGNEPPDFPATLYTRLGDPRQIGITFEKRFGS